MPDRPQWSRGQAFQCKACGRDSVVQIAAVMDGWRKAGDALVCGICGDRLCMVTDVGRSGAGVISDEMRAAATRRLASFLDTDPVERPQLAPESDANFCRDCSYFLRHPFVSRCLFHDRLVEPMQDCPQFEPCRPGEGSNKGAG